jgi:CDP-ribitol ribitolphosphotransferase
MMAAGRARRIAVARLGILVVRLGFAAGRLLPVRRTVVLAGMDAARSGGNLLAVRRELDRRNPPVPVQVVRYRTRPGLRGRVGGALDAMRAGYHLARARLFIVDDSFFPMYAITPRPGTARVQVWHAAGALKKFGYSVLDTSVDADDLAIRQVPLHANYDLCLVSSGAAIPHYMDAFRMPRERFTTAIGVPRTDLFFDAERRARATAAIVGRYALPPGRRVLLYAPTFRGDAVLDPRHDATLDLGAMRDALAPGWVLLLRLHPLVRQSLRLPPELAAFVVDVSDWPDMNELMFVADLLVTDYSSAVFEFALLDRPMAFFAPDLAAYERERGFYVDFRSSVPGPVFETTQALAEYVRAGHFDTAAVRGFARHWFDVADGQASRRFVDRIVEPALRGEPLRVEVQPPDDARVIVAPARAPEGPASHAPEPQAPGSQT